jgi:hypothetical protein
VHFPGDDVIHGPDFMACWQDFLPIRSIFSSERRLMIFDYFSGTSRQFNKIMNDSKGFAVLFFLTRTCPSP